MAASSLKKRPAHAMAQAGPLSFQSSSSIQPNIWMQLVDSSVAPEQRQRQIVVSL